MLHYKQRAETMNLSAKQSALDDEIGDYRQHYCRNQAWVLKKSIFLKIAEIWTRWSTLRAYLRVKFSTNAYPMRSAPSKPATAKTMRLSGFAAMSIRKVGGLPFSTSA